MADCIVKSPPTAGDFDFIEFSFNGESCADHGIIRISGGDRYDDSLNPTKKEVTADAPNSDGEYFFESYDKQKVFDIKFAFDNLTEVQLRGLRKWFGNKNICDLWFHENPYKVYSAKVTGQPSITAIPFGYQNEERIYKGDGTVQFTCYWPYAHTPDYVQKKNGTNYNGKLITSYSEFGTKSQWEGASGLTATNTDDVCKGENPGDLPAPFIIRITGSVPAGSTITVNDNTITTKQACYYLEWNSKTGIIKGAASNSATATKAPIDFIGNSCNTLPVGTENSISAVVGGTVLSIGSRLTISYHYWYY